jgi:hypothetical protein
MSRIWCIVLTTAALALGCGGNGGEKVIVPTEIQQPPGMDTEGGHKKKKSVPKGNKAPDAKASQSATDG